MKAKKQQKTENISTNRSLGNRIRSTRISAPNQLLLVLLLPNHIKADPSGRAVEGVGLRPLAWWYYEFKFRQRHGCMSVAGVLCFQVEVSAMDRSLVQRSPTELSQNLNNQEEGPTRAVQSWRQKCQNTCVNMRVNSTDRIHTRIAK